MRPLLAAFRAALVLFVLLSAAPAAATGCPEHFAGGTEPALVDPRLAARARELCFRAYAVLHSGVTRTPLWSAEHLTAERVEAARGLERTNAFHAEGRLPPDERVVVPTAVFKAIYAPKCGTAGAYLAPNTDEAVSGEAGASSWEAVSTARLRELSGIDVYCTPTPSASPSCPSRR